MAQMGENPRELDLHVHHGLHVRATRVSEKAASPEGPRPEFHPSLVPADYLAIHDCVNNLIAECGIAIDACKRCTRGFQERLHFVIGERPAPAKMLAGCLKAQDDAASPATRTK